MILHRVQQRAIRVIRPAGPPLYVLAALVLAAGTSVITAAPAQAATTPLVNVYGASGTFGQLGSTEPSGQTLAEHAVSGWGFDTGKSAYLTTVASDNTVFMANEDETEDSGFHQTATTTAISTYSPSSGSFSTIHIATSTGETSVGTSSNPMGADIGDVAPLNGGNAIAFTSPLTFYNGMSPSTDGQWPSFGIISKNSSGVWQIASGNQWTPDQLYNSNPQLGATACPLNSATGVHSCLGMSEMRQFPQSHDVLVMQYFGNNNPSGEFMVLHVTGPNSAGQYSVSIAADQVYPTIPDPNPNHPSQNLTVAPRTVRVDPTSSLGDERFAVIFDVLYKDSTGMTQTDPGVLQEFSYNANAGTITPVSAPILAGDYQGSTFNGFGEALYDYQGNLWVTRGAGFSGANLAIYPDSSGTRTLDANCPDTSWSSVASFTSSVGSAPSYTVPPTWGESCAPYYDLTQARKLGGSFGLVEDPNSHAVVMITQPGHAFLMPVQPTGTGTSMTFAAGDPVDTGRNLLPLPPTPSTGQFSLSNRPGAFDSSGRLWYPVQTIGQPTSTGYPPDETLDQWLYRVKVSRLFTPDAVPLSGTSGQATTIQPSVTATTSTTQAAGSLAHTDVSPTAFMTPSIDSAYPGGFSQQASNDFGVPTGTATNYTISVPSAGTYRVAYRVFTFCNSTGAITLSAGSTQVTTSINTTTSGCSVGENGTIQDPTNISLSAGTQTITLTAQTGGYYLKWFSLTRQ